MLKHAVESAADNTQHTKLSNRASGHVSVAEQRRRQKQKTHQGPPERERITRQRTPTTSITLSFEVHEPIATSLRRAALKLDGNAST